MSMKSGLFETLQHMVVRYLRAELRGEPLSVQKRRHTHRPAPLSFGVPSSIQLCVGSRQNRPPRNLGVVSEISCEGMVHGFEVEHSERRC